MASHSGEGNGKGDDSYYEEGCRNDASPNSLDAESVAFLEKEMAKFRQEFNLDKDALRAFVTDRRSAFVEKNAYDITQHLPGPADDSDVWDVIIEAREAFYRGATHTKWAEFSVKYGGSVLSNVVFPTVMGARDFETGRFKRPVLCNLVVIADPGDAARITRLHVNKAPNFTPFFFNSIISTTDRSHWEEQRKNLVEGFLPVASLSKILPVSVARAQVAERLLSKASANGKNSIDMNDFLLNETMAQLMLAMFGVSQEFMDENNKKFRDAMSGKRDPSFISSYIPALVKEMGSAACPAGPLGAALSKLNPSKSKNLTTAGNAVIFSFAGHDTTGHTLTWALFELSQHPRIQDKLLEEVDNFWKLQRGKEMQYQDLKGLDYMTRVITETLRLWPAVANGTFRKTTFEDTIKGPKGSNVRLPKGSFCVIPNWSRHRSKELWGDDANAFNPERRFTDGELYFGDGLRGYNPSSPRFSPFTFAPRDCIGKNFALMEMRVILLHLLRSFKFELAPESRDFDRATYLGVNYGTLGPGDIQACPVKRFPVIGPAERIPLGLRFLAHSRSARL